MNASNRSTALTAGVVMRRHAGALLGALAVAGALLSAGCGGSVQAAGGVAREVRVLGTDTMRFGPESIEVKAGEAVTVAFRNAGVMPHDFVTVGAAQNARLVKVGAGQEARGTFRATRPGTYAVVCQQPGHREAGMVGTIVVTS